MFNPSQAESPPIRKQRHRVGKQKRRRDRIRLLKALDTAKTNIKEEHQQDEAKDELPTQENINRLFESMFKQAVDNIKKNE